MATEVDRVVDRINQLRKDGRITSAEAVALRQQVRDLGRNGDLGAGARSTINKAIRKAASPAKTDPNPDPVVTIDPVDPDDKENGSGDGPPGPAPEGFQWVWLNDTWTLQQVPDTTEPEPVDTTPYAARTSAREFLQDLFGQLGFSAADVTSLMSSVDGWISEGLADVGNEAILARFRTTDIYKNRFAGMEALRQRGQAISEGEYVQMERSYRRVLSSYGLPPEFYDNYDDYAKFIANDISANELEDRVSTAQALLQGSGEVLAELNEYYGVGEGEALAYLLDAEKAQKVIQRQVRAAQIGGAAERSGFSMGRSQSEQLASSTLGQTLDPFNPQTSAQLESTFARARRTANRERTLADIDQESYTEMDTLQAAFGDDEKQLASERRARRERARFSGTAGAARSALSQSRNF
jgi:hypothetical protein